MCGIAGVARIDGSHLDDSADALLDALADVLTHRGPDERELYRSEGVGLAFTRLSLVDPADGSQPLSIDDGNLVLIANGEVYNHRELVAALPSGARMRTGSDCEVLLHLYKEYGVNFLDKVRGMFAVIIFDRRRGRLVLARDRFGIKPLFYHRNKQRIILGSEIKSLFTDPATPRELDWQRSLTTPLLPAAPYFGTGGLTTWFRDVESVPAGVIMSIDLSDGRTSEHRYWSLPQPDPADRRTAEDFVSAYREFLMSSISECSTADAELGLFLSGGIDSAAVAAVAMESQRDLHTFTVLSASTYRSEDAEYAHRLAGKLGLPNHQVVFEDTRIPDTADWKRLLWLLETPMCGPEVYYKHELHRYAKQARPELRGMLLGAASDEFNGGYTTNDANGGGWADFLTNIASMSRTATLRGAPDLMPWWNGAGRSMLADEAVRRMVPDSPVDPYQDYLRWQHEKIQQYNVWHEDRTAAGSGIEARVPFLDHRLVELAAGIPLHLREELLWQKRILRRAMLGTLPDEIVQRPKGPFFYGAGLRHTYRNVLSMLRQEREALVEEALAAPGAADFLDAQGLRSTLARLTENPADAQVEIALRVVNLGLLAGMVAAPPAPTAQTPVGAGPVSLTVGDWETEHPAIEKRIGLAPVIDQDAIPQFADETLLLQDHRRPNDWYLVSEGAIEYVLEQDGSEILGVLCRIDGSRTLAQILDSTGQGLDEVYPSLIVLLDENLIRLS